MVCFILDWQYVPPSSRQGALILHHTSTLAIQLLTSFQVTGTPISTPPPKSHSKFRMVWALTFLRFIYILFIPSKTAKALQPYLAFFLALYKTSRILSEIYLFQANVKHPQPLSPVTSEVIRHNALAFWPKPHKALCLPMACVVGFFAAFLTVLCRTFEDKICQALSRYSAYPKIPSA